MKDNSSRAMSKNHEPTADKNAIPEPVTLSQQQPGLITLVALCVALSLVLSLATLYIYDRWYAQKIVAVDIKGYIAQQRDDYLAGKLNDDELKKSFDHLERIITTIPRNQVVIMGDAVVRNAETLKP